MNIVLAIYLTVFGLVLAFIAYRYLKDDPSDITVILLGVIFAAVFNLGSAAWLIWGQP